MSRVSLLLPFISVLAGTSISASGEVLGSRPNVIVIITDDQGYDDVGFRGNPYLRTPHIDRLAANGLLMDAFRVNAPVCSPSRGCLLTGRWPDRNGVTRVLVGSSDQGGLGRDEVTLGEHFAAHGYRVGLVGKWHVGEQSYNLPWNRGYDTRACLLAGQIGSTFFDPRVWYGRPGEQAKRVHKKGYYTDIITDDALAFLREDADSPFLLWLAHHAPHNPLSAPDERTARCLKRLPTDMPEQRRTILAQHNAMIEVVDDGIGQVMSLLKQRGLDRNTLVVFLSDNGGLPPRQIVNVPFRGGKGTLWEGGVRVPFIVHWPGQIAGGRISQAEMSGIDLLPTICQAAGLPTAPGRHLDGVSFWNVWKGDSEFGPPRKLYAIYGLASRRYDGKELPEWYRDKPRTVQRAIWWKHWKYLYLGPGVEQGRELLYDLSQSQPYDQWQQSQDRPELLNAVPTVQFLRQDNRLDTPFRELTDLSGIHPEVVKQLRDSLETWSREVFWNEEREETD